MKRLLTILLILCGTLTYGQSAKHRTVGTDTTCIDTMRVALYMVGDLFLPIKGHFPPQWDSSRALAYSPWDSSVYVFTKYNWIKIGSGGGSTDSAIFQTVYGADTMRYNIYEAISAIVSGSIDTSIYSTRAFRVKGDDSVAALALQRVKYSDTQNMLQNYAIEAQMLGYLGLKVDYADSGNVYYSVYGVDTAKAALRSDIALRELLSNKVTSFASPNNTTYPTTAAVNSLVGSYKLKSDSFPTDGYTTRARLQKVSDSINAIIAALPTYAAGWGLTGGFTVDSYAVASRARLQKVGDSVAALIPSVSGYLQLSDTVNNVSTRSWRQKAVDSLNITIAARVKYTDTAAMLTPYLRKADSNFNGGYESYKHASITYQPIGSYVAAVTTSVNTVSIVSGANNTITVPIATGVTGLGTGVATWAATPSSANLATALTDEIGSGKAVFYPDDTSISAAYTLTTRDLFRTIHCTNGSSINLTVPASLGTTFNCVVLREGAGDVVFVASSTTLKYQPTSTTKIKADGGATIRSWATANTLLIIGSLE